MYRYVPRLLGCREATDYTGRGGSLVQTEGTVTALTSDGEGVSRFTLRDSRDDMAEIVVAPEIRSGAYGINDLAERVKLGETVRAMGLLSMEETGQAVLRVRNCDEVVAVAERKTAPAAVIADETNPRTGDGRIWFLIADFLW